MKLTDEQLSKSAESVSTMINGFKTGKIARSYSEYKRGGKKLLWVGPRMARNCKMLVDEIQRLRQEREQMVDALTTIYESSMACYASKSDMAEDFQLKAYEALKQVGELDD